MAFDPRLICKVLNEEGVAYVIVGGLAAAIHGSPLPTSDVGVVPDATDANLERLARALQRLDAKLRTEEGPVETKLDAPFLAAMPFILNLTTKYGDLDLTFDPAGPLSGFRGWNVGAEDVEISEGLTVRVAALADVIASKRAAGRAKDAGALPYLESLREQRDAGDAGSGRA